MIEGTWIFGGVEVQDRTKCFFVPVPNRTAKTLLENIEKYISPGSTIISDCWKGYTSLKDHEDYEHLTVNHTYNFVDPDTGTGATTNHIERLWRDVRSTVQKYGVKIDYWEHFERAMYLKIIPNFEQRVHKFWLQVSKMNK